MSFIKFLMEEQFDAETRLDLLKDRTTLPQEDLFLVPGIGKMTKEQAKQRVVAKLADISQRAQDPSVDWAMISNLVKDSGLRAYLDALANQREYQ